MGACSLRKVKDGINVQITLAKWRSWKLRRVAGSSNEAEVQSVTVGEDAAYHLRLLWGEVNGLGQLAKADVEQRAEFVTGSVEGIARLIAKVPSTPCIIKLVRT